MTDVTNMSAPVTRGELRVELDSFEQRLAQRFVTKEESARFATKEDLEVWAGALRAQINSDFTHHMKAFYEAMTTQFSAIDDKYADLPGRVDQLESVVFPAKRR